jgi:hypothetical protein
LELFFVRSVYHELLENAKVKQEPQGLVSLAAQIWFIEKFSVIFTWQ